jgi:hypothetical protein
MENKHRVNTLSGLFGYRKTRQEVDRKKHDHLPYRYKGETMDEIKAHVVWADGIGDSARECQICFSVTCTKPVHKDAYKVIADKLAQKWDAENQVI